VRWRDLWLAVRLTFKEWRKDKAQRLGAALAFYSVLSLSPLLVIIIAVAGRLFGAEAVRGELVGQFESAIGRGAASQVEAMIANASNPSTNTLASILGIAALLVGATGVFGQLKDALDTIWDARPSRVRGIRAFVRRYVLALGMVLGVAFLLIVFLIMSAGTTAIARWADTLPAGTVPLLRFADLAVSLGLITVMFAMVYRVLPEVRIAWKDVWIGAFVTAILFNVGRIGIGLYLGRSSVGSVFGAAGSLVVILVWIYYSASIFLLGAEFTHVYASKWGSQKEATDPGFEPPGAHPPPGHPPTLTAPSANG